MCSVFFNCKWSKKHLLPKHVVFKIPKQEPAHSPLGGIIGIPKECALLHHPIKGGYILRFTETPTKFPDGGRFIDNTCFHTILFLRLLCTMLYFYSHFLIFYTTGFTLSV